MEVCKNMQEVNSRKLFIFQHLCSDKIATDLPQLGLKEILFYHRHYSKSIDELTALENRTVHQNCGGGGLKKVATLTAKYGLENRDYDRHTVQQRNPYYVVRKTGLVVHPIELDLIAASLMD
ncbi:hypothetical protein TNIN_110691 [Trichonephila inaurata madagascariensis]|uniref:Uncharacterized protein n=1 Tax=Trichonephila inaurata madagascariensis TaxID=2747483 RepID=A0A8X7C7E0_9ARAC|nr:hypothetical protein TNIN_110691 [Trichonephila inaurata madagascariensis]